ncbi:MAG: histidine kinase [Acidobacteriota bacterium]|nr:histidine kinase [Acidobacteriota bacterium]
MPTNTPSKGLRYSTSIPLAILGLLLLSQVASGQYRFDAWTTDNGLPQDSIMAMRQTRDGYLWFTTRAGLVRFDGMRFRVFNRANTPGLSSHAFSVYNLLEDREGALWAGTWSGGAIRYKDGIFTSYTTREGLPGNAVVRIDEGPDGTIWIFTDRGLSKWKDGKLTLLAPKAGSPFNPYLVPPDKNWSSDAWFLGLWRLAPNGWERFAYGEWSRVPLPPPVTDPSKLRVHGIVEDVKHRIWFDLEHRTGEQYCLDRGRIVVYRNLPPGKQAAYADRDGGLWVRDRNSGMGIWKDGRLTPLPGFSTPSVFRAMEDRENGIWIGTRNEGLYRFRRQAIAVYRHPGGRQFNDIHPLMQDRAGNIWLSAGGLAKFDGALFRNYYRGEHSGKSENANIVSALYEDRDGSIWAASWNGIARFHDGKLVEEKSLSSRIKGRVNTIHRDSKGDLWFGGERGLDCLHERELTHFGKQEGLADGNVRVMLEDPAGELWIGTDGGLSRFRNRRFTTWTEAEGLTSNHVASLYRDDAGVLWIGTYDGGLVRFENGKFTRYTVENGLFENGVFRILEDDRGFFWVSGHLGINRLRRKDLNDFAAGLISRVASTHFGKQDGLLDAECSSQGEPAGFKSRDGKLWFPTRDGAAVVDPRAVPYNETPPPVLIEGCALDRHPVDFRAGLRVDPGKDNLEIEYTGIGFVKPEQMHFKYKLAGFDASWVDAGTRRTAYYSHLPPGAYSFAVLAANSDGVWNTQGAQLSVIVVPPFYRTWWFTILLSLSAATMLCLAGKRRVEQLQRERIGQQAFSRQLIASQESERKRIAAELHDSLGQRLVVIKNLALLSLLNPDQAEARRHIEEISAEASGAIGEVKEISYNLRPYQLDRIGLTKAIQGIVKSVAAASRIDVTADLDDVDDCIPKDAQIDFYRIVQESLNNVVKHSQATRASVTARRHGDRLSLSIRDNGRGFTPQRDPESPAGGFGLTGIVERSQLLGGKTAIRSTPGQGGTVIEIEIPLKTFPASAEE